MKRPTFATLMLGAVTLASVFGKIKFLGFFQG
jgi:hypothetical protein